MELASRGNVGSPLVDLLSDNDEENAAHHSTSSTMAGPIRQPIDLDKLGKYIEHNVPEIKTPIDVKQVCLPAPGLTRIMIYEPFVLTLHV